MAVKFDLSGIPKDAKITKAELGLFAYAIPSASVKLKNAPKLIAKITSAWVEGNITWNTVPAVSGAALATCFNTQVNTWESFDVTSDVKAIVETNGPNNGYLLKFPMHDHGIKYHSSESSTAGNRPKLTITYESSTAVLPGWNIPAEERYTGIITTMQGRRIQTFVIKDLRGIGRAAASLSAGVYIVTISTPAGKFNAQRKLVK